MLKYVLLGVAYVILQKSRLVITDFVNKKGARGFNEAEYICLW